jgi:predicted HicB family RNase H-like nuclease
MVDILDQVISLEIILNEEAHKNSNKSILYDDQIDIYTNNPKNINDVIQPSKDKKERKHIIIKIDT